MNRHDFGRFDTESLESAAKRYKTLGLSIIPLQGARNPQQPKLPAIKWARFQHTYPSDEEIQTWFHVQPDAGIGIVCGRISRLMVLDFDDAAAVSEFRHQHPEMLNTFTVRSGTRGLPHFYYRLPEGKLVTTSAYPGADLRGEGAYVVAPPTCVGNAQWVIENDVPIHAISEFELRRVMRFLAGLKAVEEQEFASSDAVDNPMVSEFRHVLSEAELIAHYRHICSLGRNQALFKTTILARESGVSELACAFILASIHAREPGIQQEDYKSRYEEALRTIASVYKRPPRQQRKPLVFGLGNAAREWLLRNGQAALARVLDGLYAVGLKPDQSCTELEAREKLVGLKIGRRSIMEALKARIGGNKVFEVVESPLYPPIDANAAKGSDDLNNSCEMSRGAKRVKIIKRGRPARVYRMPAPGKVAELIGIKGTSSDQVATEDFASPRMYRQALHRQLLERRPGHYARVWLSERLGISRWTTRRYEKAANLYVEPAYAAQPLSWSLAAKLPESREETAFGVFLEASDGKRYPAIRGLALKLLKQGYVPILKHQQTNYYAVKPERVGIPTPQWQSTAGAIRSCDHYLNKVPPQPDNLRVGIPTPAIHAQVEKGNRGLQPFTLHDDIPARYAPMDEHDPPDVRLPRVGIPTPHPEPIFWLCPECLDFHVTIERPKTCSRCGCDCEWEIVPSVIWRDTQALKYWWQRRYRDHQQVKKKSELIVLNQREAELLPEARILAEQVHAEIPGLSLSNARKVVREFGGKLIEKALLVVRGRKGLRSPAGFLIAFLRSEKKLLSTNSKHEYDHMPQMKGESTVEWVRRLAKSQYLNFIANADDILNLGSINDPSPA